jgi:hypothetical protein
VLTVDNGKLASLDWGDHDRGEARPTKFPGNAVDVLAPLPNDGTLVGGVDNEVCDFQPLQHWGCADGRGFGLLKALG